MTTNVLPADLATTPGPKDPKAFQSPLKPIWCPGCGDYGVAQAIYRALAAVGRPSHEVAFISGIGCSSRIPGYSTAYGFNTLHGRALPIAQGVKLSRPELLVLVAGGDGDGFSIGGGHLSHAIRRNMNLTYLVMDNQVYGLTKGQLSPTASVGRLTVTSPYGSIEEPVNPLLYVLGYGCGFVAQGTPAKMQQLAGLIEEAIRYPGFAFVNIQSPCVTFGDMERQMKDHLTMAKPLDTLGHDPSDQMKAMDLARQYGHALHTGVFYRNPNPPTPYEEQLAVRQTEQKAKAVPRQRALDKFMVNRT